MNFTTIIKDLSFKTMAYNILSKNAPTDEATIRFLQDNSLQVSKDQCLHCNNYHAGKVCPLYCIQHGHTVNIEQGTQHCSITDQYSIKL